MVYYPANQLLIKTEQPSQAQFCLQVPPPLTAMTTSAAGMAIASSGGQQEHYELLQTPQQRQLQLQQQQQQQHRQEQQQFVSYQLTIQQQQQHESITTTTPPTAAPRIKTEPPVAGFPATTTAPTQQQQQQRKPAANKPQFKCEQCGMTFGSKSAHTSHTKSHAKNAELSLNGGLGGLVSSSTSSSPAIELNEAGLPVGIPKSPTIKPLANVAAGADPYQCNVCQKTFAVPARLVSFSSRNHSLVPLTIRDATVIA